MTTKTPKHHSRSIFRYLLSRDTFFATLAVFAIMGLLSKVEINTHVLDPIKLALHDFNYNDLAYAKMGKNKDFPADTNIIIVNIGEAQRPEIAAMIDHVMLAGPKVVGVDVLFNESKAAETDQLLETQFKQYPNLVLAYKLEEKEERFSPDGIFYATANHKGYANFVGEEEGVIRYFKPTTTEGGTTFDSFSAAMLKIVDSARYKTLISRKDAYEVINYRRSADKFLVIQGTDVLNGAADLTGLRNKIVMLGYTGRNAHDIEDKHFTPLNTHFAGRGVPDMNGIFIHSNIIGMELDNALISQTPAWINWILAFVIAYISMAFFIKYCIEMHMWFHLIAKIVQIVMAVLFVYLGLWMFYKFDTQINMTATLVAVILAVDVLYFYQSFALWLHKKVKYKTVFTHETNH